MAITADTIDHATLERLAEAGAVRGANIVAQPGGWGVAIQYGMTGRVLAAKRGAVRIFRKFETLYGALILPFWKPAAIADRKRITAYIAQDNPRAAIEMGDRLINVTVASTRRCVQLRTRHGSHEVVRSRHYGRIKYPAPSTAFRDSACRRRSD